MNFIKLNDAVEISIGAWTDRAEFLLDKRFLNLLTTLHRKFERRRDQLLAVRLRKQESYDQGSIPRTEILDVDSILPGWSVAPIPEDLKTRRVEITGPVNDTKMVINMLSRNSEGVKADMAMLDFEDSMMPTWKNVIDGVYNVIGASTGILEYKKMQVRRPTG